MNPVTESPSSEEMPYTTSLILKEYFFMLLIVCMGLSGLSLCITKVYGPKERKMERMIVHEADLAQAKLSVTE